MENNYSNYQDEALHRSQRFFRIDELDDSIIIISSDEEEFDESGVVTNTIERLEDYTTHVLTRGLRRVNSENQLDGRGSPSNRVIQQEVQSSERQQSLPQRSYRSISKPSCSHDDVGELDEEDGCLHAKPLPNQSTMLKGKLCNGYRNALFGAESRGLKRKKHKTSTRKKSKHFKRELPIQHADWHQGYESDDDQSGYDTECEDDPDDLQSGFCQDAIDQDTPNGGQLDRLSSFAPEQDSDDSDYPEFDSDIELDDPMFFREDHIMPLPDFDPMTENVEANAINESRPRQHQRAEPAFYDEDDVDDEGYESVPEEMTHEGERIRLSPVRDGTRFELDSLQAVAPFFNSLHQQQVSRSESLTLFHGSPRDRATRDFLSDLQRCIDIVRGDPPEANDATTISNEVIVIESDSEDEADRESLGEVQIVSPRPLGLDEPDERAIDGDEDDNIVGLQMPLTAFNDGLQEAQTIPPEWYSSVPGNGQPAGSSTVETYATDDMPPMLDLNLQRIGELHATTRPYLCQRCRGATHGEEQTSFPAGESVAGLFIDNGQELEWITLETEHLLRSGIHDGHSQSCPVIGESFVNEWRDSSVAEAAWSNEEGTILHRTNESYHVEIDSSFCTHGQCQEDLIDEADEV